ncbi:winged helix-turn-helix domain-containing protein [Roseicyclus persicicus]|uniref:Winged helix-turn-helix domain-containing protein n=1 Tax=Roseicyclus persicicus TaxID=2650661 RepID=A0A7X6GYQ7_9RHOB|nr:crosslink repair DNA glycosylase YcaQ family protein [Roseibacterium persicicum]NKX43958.1 winged helix-turn-helix domain-containing protein [Roseibacterium persicicum]
MHRIDNAAARRLFLDAHALTDRPAGPGKGAELAALIHRLGFVQVDSVNTLARAHDLILWSRRPSYRPDALRRLNDRDRATFEHWTHDASVIPVAFFPHWRLRFARDRDRLRARWNDWQGSAFHAEIETVLRHVTDHGAVHSAEIGEARAEKSTGWWDWHPSKTALEYLWRCGDLAITRREGFRKFYDLTERVIPPEHLDAHLPDAAIVDWACEGALDRLGFATSGELAAFWALITPAEAKDWAARALAEGRVAEAEIACADGAPRRVLIRPDTLDRLADLPEPPGRLRVLSPFDPSLRDRKRAERLFGFCYRIEIFVPEPQRRYGYYVFPLLEGDRIVGRIDMAADRQAGALKVRALWPEAGVRWGQGRQGRLEAELDRLLPLAGCDRVGFADGWLRPPGSEG